MDSKTPVPPNPSSSDEDARIVSKALLRVMDLLGLSQQEVSQILHVSPASVSRWANAKGQVEPSSAEGQLALLFLRIFRSLDTLVGGDVHKAGLWLRAENHHLGGIPLTRIRTPEGLVHVAEYLDAMRGKA